ncbi:MAG: porin family protein [Candidatus Kapabacteria bacterium]|nr:porin family protein [Candidatus Kapabacteria bacterium]
MKKSIITFIITSIFILNYAVSQESNEYTDRISLGAKGGFNYSNVWDSEGEEFEAEGKFGLVLGAFAQIPVWQGIGFQPALLFSQKGFKGTGKILGSNYEITRTTNYIDLPLLASFTPFKFLTFVAGPQYSYLLSQNDEFKNAYTTIAQEQEFANDDIRNNTLSFLLGIDVNYDNLVFGTRLGWDLLNNQADESATTPRYKNAWWQLTVGYRFN